MHDGGHWIRGILVAFLAICSTAVKVGADATAVARDKSSGQEIDSSGTSNTIASAAFSPNGKAIITVGNNGKTATWRVWSGACEHDWTIRLRAARFGFVQYGPLGFIARSHYLVWNSKEYNIDIPRHWLTLTGQTFLILMVVILVYWQMHRTNRSVKQFV
jgi:hypothetical protein